ncbi:50S ribosomal protein L15 [Candidatus Woesearchaeota archaeon]|nr:50S ribosomal protein L15 [Candidatus Woesearchaeota archaeon]
MTTYKKRKNRNMRGSQTHGWGAKKKHRGAGSRGGRGMAGTGKRGDAKKPCIWKDTKYFGKYGFKRPKKITIKIKAINLKTIEQSIESLLSKKLIEKKNDSYVIDLKKLGFNKVLSTGKITKKFNIKCDYASKKAVEKIKESGGSIVLKEKKVKIVKEKPKKEKPVVETIEKVEKKPKEKEPIVETAEEVEEEPKEQEKPIAQKAEKKLKIN